MLIIYNNTVINFDHVQAIDIVRVPQTQRLSLKVYTMLPAEDGCGERARLLGSYTDIEHAQKALTIIVKAHTLHNDCAEITYYDK